MEFCTGGDLHSLLMRGVEYIHEMGVAHLDLKPKNLLLTYDGLLKISDFGHSECVRFAWEKDVHRVSGIPNPDPYVAPEEYTGGGFDGYAVDIWACGVIYMSMITGRCLWRTAKTSEDASYSQYIEARRQQEGFEPIESLPRVLTFIVEVQPSPLALLYSTTVNLALRQSRTALVTLSILAPY
ncbi:HAL protein kinase [Fusarium keratoplasticum]|nr:HAL protein kinase [Fusarium keratoplasticum]